MWRWRNDHWSWFAFLSTLAAAFVLSATFASTLSFTALLTTFIVAFATFVLAFASFAFPLAFSFTTFAITLMVVTASSAITTFSGVTSTVVIIPSFLPSAFALSLLSFAFRACWQAISALNLSRLWHSLLVCFNKESHLDTDVHISHLLLMYEHVSLPLVTRCRTIDKAKPFLCIKVFYLAYVSAIWQHTIVVTPITTVPVPVSVTVPVTVTVVSIIRRWWSIAWTSWWWRPITWSPRRWWSPAWWSTWWWAISRWWH
mmetsp:Transcript_152059/g.279770  ORF Transcript_152059/g.279770 Transcript_152059/m.279770 type:complete len:258 (-) Transcript_152059:997-1770(-)